MLGGGKGTKRKLTGLKGDLVSYKIHNPARGDTLLSTGKEEGHRSSAGTTGKTKKVGGDTERTNKKKIGNYTRTLSNSRGSKGQRRTNREDILTLERAIRRGSLKWPKGTSKIPAVGKKRRKLPENCGNLLYP